MLLERPNLCAAVAAEIRHMIGRGDLPSGEQVDELDLAAQFGVSRTPLREALWTLVAEGALTSVPRRGFFVRALSADEVHGIYPIRAILDPAALRAAGVPTTPHLDRLSRLNQRLAEAVEPLDAVEKEDEWHRALLAGCPNPVLLDLIQQFMWRTRRYELALMRAGGSMQGSVASKTRIIAALRERDLEGACAELAASMTRGKEPVLRWLAEHGRNTQSARGRTRRAANSREAGHEQQKE